MRRDLQTRLSTAVPLCMLATMNRALCLAALLLTGFTLHAEDEEKHPLDKKVAALTDAANSTMEMQAAFEKGNKLWNAELNRCYGELKKKLQPDAFAALQAAQRQWIAYRDAQYKFIAEFYGHFDGTMYIPMRSSAAMDITRARALELKHHLEVLEEHGG